jgi:aconitate hydratase
MNPFNSLSTLQTASGPVDYYSLGALEAAGLGEISTLPYCIKILLEAATRKCDGFGVTEDHIRLLAKWSPEDQGEAEIPFCPARVILQDFTGVPAVVDLAALRSAMARMGGDPKRINPQVPVDLVIDHSVQVDHFDVDNAEELNSAREFERNAERYDFLRWGQLAFDDFRVVPPSTGIVHQVNLEFLATCVQLKDGVAFPDTLVGTDSHTTMINGLGVLGWGVGGIEAEAVLLGQPIYMLLPKVVGVELTGKTKPGVTATDLVLTIVEMLREHGVVGKLVEFYGEGLDNLSLADRATIANMGPEYGATSGFFPVDEVTLGYMRVTGRDESIIDRVREYNKAQGLFREPGATPPRYSEYVSLDMSTVEPCISGPKRPQDRIALTAAKAKFHDNLTQILNVTPTADKPAKVTNDQADRGDTYAAERVPMTINGQEYSLTHGSIGIAAITSCTNTSNPSVLVAAGLVAKKAAALGLNRRPWVKTSLAPGSRAVTGYLEKAGLLTELQSLGFGVVGYGCTTCIGNSGPIVPGVKQAVIDGDLVLTSVLSGNRNFEGRISPMVRANYLASPPLVVAYAIAGTVDIDMEYEPLGTSSDGNPVYLKDIWPSDEEIQRVVASSVKREIFEKEYSTVFDANARWNAIGGEPSDLYAWNSKSTYIQEPPFFQGLTTKEPKLESIKGARVLALLGDTVTTDHISPAGAIPADSPTTTYLKDNGVALRDFNSYGSRRGNHEVMMRGTFGNIRLKNLLAPGTEGGWTTNLNTGKVTSIFDASMDYQSKGTPLVVLAGVEYGTGSSRDWAAKGTYLLGVKAVVATSYERIHRSNLVGMGVLPLEFLDGESASTFGFTGTESFDIAVPSDLEAGQNLTVVATRENGAKISFETRVRIDSPIEVRYYKNGGILHTVLRDMAKA